MGLRWEVAASWLWHVISGFVAKMQNSVNQKFKEGFVKEVRLTLDRRLTPSANDQEFQKNLKKFVK